MAKDLQRQLIERISGILCFKISDKENLDQLKSLFRRALKAIKNETTIAATFLSHNVEN